MAKITITLRDTPAGGVSVHTVSEPPYAVPATPAQMAAMEMARRTAREWGLPQGSHKQRERLAPNECQRKTYGEKS